MAIMYVFSVDDPNNSGPFPPEVIASDWYNNLLDYANFNSIGGPTSYVWSFVFNDNDELKSWQDDYTLTDTDLLASLRKWSVDHNIVYNHKFYTLPEVSNKGLF